jgi:hypothetical protein
LVQKPTLPLLLAMLFVFEGRLDAYLDPGSGSLLVQLLLGGVAGIGVILRLAWLRLRGRATADQAEDRSSTRDE